MKSDEKFIWIIGIVEGLDEMKYADIGEHFGCKYFDVFGSRLKVKWYPNGRINKNKNTQRLCFDICIHPKSSILQENDKIFLFCKVHRSKPWPSCFDQINLPRY